MKVEYPLKKSRFFIMFLTMMLCFLLSVTEVKASILEEREQEDETFYLWEQMKDYDLKEIEDGFTGLFPDCRIDMNELFSLIIQ